MLRDVQRAAGVSNSAAYRHYADRQALLTAVREQRPACEAAGRTDNTGTSLVVGFFPREASVSTDTSSITMLWSPSPDANTLGMRNAVHPSSS